VTISMLWCQIKRKGGNCVITFGASKAIKSPVESKLDLDLDGS
jgi:hypothetical protein